MTTSHPMPAKLSALIQAHMASRGRDYSDAGAMWSECWDESRALEVALDGHNADGCEIYAATVAAPVAELAGDDKADGHYVCRVEYADESGTQVWDVDLTAAQFSQLGWNGPRADLVG